MAEEKILVIEDDDLIGESLSERLRREGYEVVIAGDGASGRREMAGQEFDLLLLDHRLPDTTGLELLGEFATEHPDMPVIMMTAYSTVEGAVAAMKKGAFLYLDKPFNMDEMLLAVRNALETTRLRREVRLLRRGQIERFGFDRILGQDPRMMEILALVQKIVAHGASTILIEGESGTGKDLLAKTIHYSGPRADSPFMNITCSALPSELLESELFGHERGAFTDARTQKKGLFEVARGGTVLLDEIGDMPMPLQAKLLRFLEERAFKRVGGTVDIRVDVHVVAATNRNLEEMVRAGTFRNDLYYRLKVIPIRMPALRERKGDIPLLVQHFVDAFNREFKRRYRGAGAVALKILQDYPWPGNIRELKNVIERAFILGNGDEIRPEDLPAEIREQGNGSPAPRSLYVLPPEGIDMEAVETDLVRQALERTHGNQTQAARLLRMTRDQIKYRVKKLNGHEWGKSRATATIPAATES
ncbi:MAG: sigma-54-dependent Fis family transcriptional regulator [Planctomycetes bacterium]|nr:sigma-54-dependent Fis family transcriptional regulator [Planctomycetota bacterium]